MPIPEHTSPRIRPIAICLFRHEGRILVFQGHDSVKGLTFYRPLGGGIEFGETSAEAVTREIREELGAEIVNLRLLGTLENIFMYHGKPGHEIVQVFDGEFADRGLYDQAQLPVMESGREPFVATWRNVKDFSLEQPLFPQGLPEMIDRLPAEDRCG